MKIPVGRRMSFRGSEEEDERIIHVSFWSVATSFGFFLTYTIKSSNMPARC